MEQREVRMQLEFRKRSASKGTELDSAGSESKTLEPEIVNELFHRLQVAAIAQSIKTIEVLLLTAD